MAGCGAAGSLAKLEIHMHTTHSEVAMNENFAVLLESWLNVDLLVDGAAWSIISWK